MLALARPTRQNPKFLRDLVHDFARCVRPDGSAYGSRGKCRKGTEQAKPERGGEEAYKPKKLSGRGLVNIDQNQIKYSAFDVESAREDYETLKESLPGKLKDLDSEDLPLETKNKKKETLKNNLASAKIALKQAENNRKFLSRLEKSVPKGVELRVTGTSGVVMLSKSKGGNNLTITYSPNDGFNFTVNGRFSAGEVKDRREQIEIAFMAKKCWDSLIRSLPEGTIVKTSAWEADGKGEERQRAYMRVGFSKRDERDENMYSQKKDGAMVPTRDRETFLNQEKDPTSLYFSENSSEIEEVKVWLQILTGEDFLSGKAKVPDRSDFFEGKSEYYDFTRCVRPDGSAYGTAGKCRKGVEVEITRLETGLFAIDHKGERVGRISAPGALKGGGGIKGQASYDLDLRTPDGKRHQIQRIPTLAAAKAKARQLLGEEKKGGNARAIAQGGLTTKGKARRIKNLEEDLDDIKGDMKVVQERFLSAKERLGAEGVKQDRQARELVLRFKALKERYESLQDEIKRLRKTPVVD